MSNVTILDQPRKPQSWQNFVQPAILISLGLHFVFLLLPLAGSQSPSQPKPLPKDDKVKLIELPTEETARTAAAPSPTAAPSATPSASIKPTPNPTASASPSPSPTISKSPLASLSPKAIPSVTPKASTTPKPSASPSQTPKPSETPKPSASATQTPKPTETPKPKPPTGAPFSDFPIYPGTTPSPKSKGARQTTDAIDKVSSFFTSQLPTKGYKVKVAENTATRKVYELEQQGVTRFLTILSDNPNTVFALGDKPLDNLQNTKGASPEETAFEAAVAKIPFKPADATFSPPEKLPDPTPFIDPESDLPRNGIDGNIKFIAGQAPDGVLSGVLTPGFTGFQVTPKGSFGGGNLYEVKMGEFSRYINLVPAKDSSGTVVVIWTASPI